MPELYDLVTVNVPTIRPFKGYLVGKAHPQSDADWRLRVTETENFLCDVGDIVEITDDEIVQVHPA